ncbi:hypothetical protein AVEN_124785-1 [Araneus ventricosus]|uniref:Uncharacterized protein n=1 Tax=Araneus ventricosus TaxID=182803 RepID=A0A4Y2P1V5_ARAVE|nr:hypothetical protein AVEN_124785-1 [Araneus ventricosus]
MSEIWITEDGICGFFLNGYQTTLIWVVILMQFSRDLSSCCHWLSCYESDCYVWELQNWNLWSSVVRNYHISFREGKRRFFDRLNPESGVMYFLEELLVRMAEEGYKRSTSLFHIPTRMSEHH